MSCQHGNWDGACGICEELDRQYELGKASARKEIERLTAERDALKEGLDGWHARFLDVEVERDALAQNAERVRVYKQRCLAAIAERDALKQFALKILDNFPELGTFDGGDIQDIAVECGLLIGKEVNAPCGEGCYCAEYGFPVTCYRKVEFLK